MHLCTSSLHSFGSSVWINTGDNYQAEGSNCRLLLNCKVISSFIYFPLESTTSKKKKEHKLFGRLQFTRSVNLSVKFGVLDCLPVKNVIHNLFSILAQPVKREGVCVCVRERERERAVGGRGRGEGDNTDRKTKRQHESVSICPWNRC